MEAVNWVRVDFTSLKVWMCIHLIFSFLRRVIASTIVSYFLDWMSVFLNGVNWRVKIYPIQHKASWLFYWSWNVGLIESVVKESDHVNSLLFCLSWEIFFYLCQDEIWVVSCWTAMFLRLVCGKAVKGSCLNDALHCYVYMVLML